MAQDQGRGDIGSGHWWMLFQALYIISKQVASVETKLNKLLERAGSGDDEQLRQLTEQLQGPTESLQSAVEANQPPK